MSLLGRLASAAAVTAVLTACAPAPKLRAAWYLAAEADTEADPSSSSPATSPIVVTVLNVGIEPVDVWTISLNADDGPLLWRRMPSDSRLLPSGAMLVLATSLSSLPTTCGAQQVILPVRVYVRINQRRRAKRIDITNPMPSSLADTWWPRRPTGCPKEP